MKSGTEAKEILKEINESNLLINYIDGIIDGHSGGINNTRAYNNNRNGNKETGQTTATTTREKLGASQQQSPQSTTHRETIANDTTENNKDKIPWKARSQTNKPESKITNTMPELVRKAEAGDTEGKSPDRVVTECDRSAAHPKDPEKVAEGMAWDDLDPKKVITQYLVELPFYYRGKLKEEQASVVHF